MRIARRVNRRNVPNQIGPLLVPRELAVGETFVVPNPTSASPGTWTFVSSDPRAVEVVGNTIRRIRPGSITLSAIQVAVPPFVLGHVTGFIETRQPAISTLGPLLITNLMLCNPSFSITQPRSNSDGAWTYTSSDPNIVSIAGNVLSTVRPGSATITASQAATPAFQANSVSVTITVTAKRNVLGALTIPRMSAGSTFTITPPATESTGAWTYTSSNTNTVTVAGNVLTGVSAGTSLITATQAADACYEQASVSALVTIIASVAIVGPFEIPPLLLCTPSITLTPPTSPSNGAWTFTSSNTAIVTISGNVLTVVGVGTATVTARQAATASYAASTKTAAAVVSSNVDSVAAGSRFFIPDMMLGDPPYTIIDPPSLSTSPWVYTSNNKTVATVSGRVITLLKTGTADISANKVADRCYLPATLRTTFQVTQIPLQLGPLIIQETTAGDPPFTIRQPTSNSNGAFTYSSANSAILQVTPPGNMLTPRGAGSTLITATQAASGTLPGGTVSGMGVVNRPKFTLSVDRNSGGYQVLEQLKRKYTTINQGWFDRSAIEVTLTIQDNVWVVGGRNVSGKFASTTSLLDSGAINCLLAAGSLVKIINKGFIVGDGGNGGGEPGWPAIYATCEVSVDNSKAGAYIAGGGGGGGSGVGLISTSPLSIAKTPAGNQGFSEGSAGGGGGMGGGKISTGGQSEIVQALGGSVGGQGGGYLVTDRSGSRTVFLDGGTPNFADQQARANDPAFNTEAWGAPEYNGKGGTGGGGGGGDPRVYPNPSTSYKLGPGGGAGCVFVGSVGGLGVHGGGRGGAGTSPGSHGVAARTGLCAGGGGGGFGADGGNGVGWKIATPTSTTFSGEVIRPGGLGAPAVVVKDASCTVTFVGDTSRVLSGNGRARTVSTFLPYALAEPGRQTLGTLLVA